VWQSPVGKIIASAWCSESLLQILIITDNPGILDCIIYILPSMKKGGIVSQKLKPAADRKRTENFVQEPPKATPPSGVTQWRKSTTAPSLGGSSRDWELPDNATTGGLNFVRTWEEAETESQKRKREQQPSRIKKHTPTVLPYNAIQYNSKRPYVGSTDEPSIITFSTASVSRGGIMSGAATAVTDSTSGSSVQNTKPSDQKAKGRPPKDALYAFYGKKPRGKQLSNEDYIVWNNNAAPHELRFTAIFHCPLTGECFPAGAYGDSSLYNIEITTNHQGKQVEVVWYTKKSLAEHGASCRVLDCMEYRDALVAGNDVDPAAVAAARRCASAPYTRREAPNLPPIPAALKDKIDERNKRIAAGVATL